MSQRLRLMCGVVFPVKVIIALFLITLFSCKKDGEIDSRLLAIGTKCNVYSGVFGEGDKTPADPVTVTSIYRPPSSGLTVYNVTDSNGLVWVIPDNDLQVIK